MGANRRAVSFLHCVWLHPTRWLPCAPHTQASRCLHAHFALGTGATHAGDIRQPFPTPPLLLHNPAHHWVQSILDEGPTSLPGPHSMQVALT